MAFEIENGVLKKYTVEKGVTEITIPDSVISIGSEAFRYCEELESITIPNGVTIIGDYAFSGCESLKSMTIPDGVTSIGNYAFYHCTSLTSITIPESVTSIGKEAFRYCEELESITIPDSVKSVGKRAFFGGTKIIICKGNAKILIIPDKNRYSYDYQYVLNKIIISDIDNCQQYFNKLGFRYKVAVAMSIISAYPDKTYYSDYLKSSVKNVVRLFIDEENIDLLYRFLDFGFVTENNIDSLISYAVEHTQNGGNAELQLILSKYKSENFSSRSSDTFDKFVL